MNLTQILDSWKNDPAVMDHVTCWRQIPAQKAHYAPWPDDLDARLVDMLKKRGIQAPYSHQAEAMEHIAKGRDTVVVTPTASGKSLCYHIPVLNDMLRDPNARALYLFPTKALSADQVSELYELIEMMGVDIKTYTYDGDTPVYGVAVGQNLTTREVDGETVVEQNNFRAVFTARRLGFWQDDTEIAYLSDNRLYITDITVLSGLNVGSWRMDSTAGLAFQWMGG